MQTSPRIRSTNHQPGIAIVVVVSLMAMLSLMVIAFLLLSTTNRNNANLDVSIRQADSIAELAKETLIADLVSEMKAGAAAITDTADGKQSFTIVDPKFMVPERAAKPAVKSDALFKPIVKQSAGGTKFHEIASPGFAGKIRASAISTTTPSVDGRKIAETRWSAPKLLDPAVTFTSAQAPDWIYTARNGTNPTTATSANSQSTNTGGVPNPEYIVGRYAYQVYDVSGLLDANVAGYGSSAPPANAMSRKGSLVWADLAALPPSSANPSKLVDWRRASSKALAADEFIREWGGVRGWMRTPLAAGQSDNVYLSRRELIAYQNKIPTDLPSSLLPYLTTLSRELNQPSWAPTIDAGGAFDYKANMDKDSATNRRFSGIRVKAEFTRRDGTKAKVGEPLMLSRFPLSKIQAFADNNQADVRKYFGLAPAQSSGGTVISWTHANSAGGKIKRLDQVAAENREPDFFETLKAGILEGSVGNFMTQNSFFMDQGRDLNSDYQILRIGASIIDQWDSDDNPTIIQYGLTNPLTGVRPDDVAGVENLPYFHFLGESRFRRRDLGAPPNDSTAATFITFQLWNPHKNAVDGNIAAGTYRLAFSGKSYMRWHTFPATGYSDPAYDPYIRFSPLRTADFSQDYLQFTVSNSFTFAQPTYLKPGKAGISSSRPIDTIAAGGAPVIGYNVGEVSAPYPSVALHNQRYGRHGLFSNYDVPMSFALQKNIAGTWVSYQIIPEWGLTHGFVVGSLVDNTNRLYSNGGDYLNLHGMLSDPRTTRYGISSTTGGTDAINKTTGNRSYDNRFFPPGSWTHPGSRKPEQYPSNSAGGNTVVVNRDGKRRPADDGDSFNNPEQRPVILNRPFQSVADMGYAFRDEPWTSINLYGDPADATNPGDGALLDLFSLTETPIRAGVVNPNAAPLPVLKALLSQAAIREGVSLTAAQAEAYAAAIRTMLDDTPLLNPAEIAIVAGKVATKGSIPGFRNNQDMHVIARALADTASVRTWSLMVDVIAQSGRLTRGTTNLSQFISQAERRYWYHIVMDRFTGEIISLQKENAAE
jgi:hypothetical protein